MKDVVVVITITLTDENLVCEEFQEFLDEIKSGKMREEMMSEIFEDIKIKFQVYKHRKPPQ
jgi:hypothetical protein